VWFRGAARAGRDCRAKLDAIRGLVAP
jgi:hypothetical protein